MGVGLRTVMIVFVDLYSHNASLHPGNLTKMTGVSGREGVIMQWTYNGSF